jgi:prepilin-type N-terminal cleavage/methylation domain-containing protein
LKRFLSLRLKMAKGKAEVQKDKPERTNTVDKLKKRREQGFSLVELIVVMAIIATLAALAVPGIAMLRPGAKQELSRANREIYTLLRAAKIYASTYNVDTAVAFFEAPEFTSSSPAGIMSAAAVFYKLPKDKVQSCIIINDAGNSEQRNFDYLPLPNDSGQFREFPGRFIVYLPPNWPPDGVVIEDTTDSNDTFTAVSGSKNINTYLPSSDPGEFILDFATHRANDMNICDDPERVRTFPAYIFEPSGRIDSGSSKERLTLYVAPRPDEDSSVRLIDPEYTLEIPGQFDITQLVHRTIHLYKSTGRLKTTS